MTTVSTNSTFSDWTSYLGSNWSGSSAGGQSQASGGSSNYNTGVLVVKTGTDIAKIIKSNASDRDKVYAVRDRVGLAVADYYTAGYASTFYNYANKHWPGTMEKIRAFDRKWYGPSIIVNKLFSAARWRTEGIRMGKLLQKGINIPEDMLGAMTLTRGRSKEELIDHSVALDFVGRKTDGAWVNNRFATSREEKELKPEDIWGYATFFEKFGNDWLEKFDETDRRAICQKALDLNLVREHHGTVDVKWDNTELTQFCDQLQQSKQGGSTAK